MMRRTIGDQKVDEVLDLSHTDLNDYGCPKNARSASPCVLGLTEGNNVVFYSLDPFRGKGPELGHFEVGGRYMGWDISPDGSKVALVDEEKYGNNIQILTLANGTRREIAVDPAVGHLQKVGWTTDGRTFFVTSITPWGHTLAHIATTGRAQTLWQVVGQGRSIESPLSSPDGRYVAFNGETWDSNVWLVDKF